MSALLSEWRRIKTERVLFPIDMNEEDERNFQLRLRCHQCYRRFKNSRNKTRHHDHLKPSRNYIGAYCSRCNLAARDLYNNLPMFAHNASYDIALILKQLQSKHTIDIMTKDNLKFFKVGIDKEITLLDSLQFMRGSLETLAANFLRDGNRAKCVEHMLRNIANEEDRQELIRGKEVMCYDYLDSPAKLDEPTLPPREAFYNKLKQQPLSEEAYQRACRIFIIGECKTLRDYLLLYLKIDVGFLGDCLNNWREILFEKYGLDICHYVSLPSFAFDASLKHSNIELDHQYDYEFYSLIRDNVRGGYAATHCQKYIAKNMHTKPDFDEEREESSYAAYLDFNSLYSSCMVEPLPTGNIRKLTDEEQIRFVEGALTAHDCENSNFNYWLLIDTKPLAHDVISYTDDLPLGMIHRSVEREDLSPYCRNILELENGLLYKSGKKLVATHEPKKDYLISLNLLQLFLKLGMQIEKVHCIYEYEQSSFMKDFITGNIQSRIEATSKIEKDAFKEISNSVFGKYLLNVLKYNRNSKLITSKNSFIKEVSNPRLKEVIYLKEDRVICVSSLKSVLVNFPAYIGYMILEKAKYKLYHFYYEVLKKNYSDRVRLLYTDTDSLLFELKCKDLNHEFSKPPLNPYLDLSNFPNTHPLYNEKRKGQLGLLKSEVGCSLITSLIALKPKLYVIQLLGEDIKSRGKGIPKHEQNKLTFEDFEETLQGRNIKRVTVNNIQNIKGQMCSTKTFKKSLSAFDDKRYHLSCNRSVAYGHYSIPIRDRSINVQTETSLLPRLHTSSPMINKPGICGGLFKGRINMVRKYFSPR